jgi:Xaa-Pro aminopeptidase
MNPERFAKYDQVLEREGFDGFLSANGTDVRYLTGSEDSHGVVVYRPGREPIVLIREAGAQCARDSARAEIRSFNIVEGPLSVIATTVHELGLRRVAVASYSTADDLLGIADTSARSLGPGLAEALPDVEWTLRPHLGPDLRRVKGPDEIDAMRRAVDCIRSGYSAMFAAIKPGVVDRVAAATATGIARSSGADSIRYIQVKAGLRTAYSDATTVGRPFGENEAGVVDMDVLYDRYSADCTRVFIIGDPPRDVRRIVETVDSIQREVRGMVRPGVNCADLYHQARRLFADAGYPNAIPHYLGHGIGLAGDRHPILMPGSEEVLVEGEVICVEPGVYVPGVGGARIEDMIFIGPRGNEVLTASIERVSHCG